jgi:hypothetical protein
MNMIDFYTMIKENDLEVTFKKKSDGSERTIRCTSNVPEDKLSPDKKVRIHPEGLVTVFDVNLGEWRSLYVDSIIEVKKLVTSYGLLQEEAA